jgi:two-component system sensor kinase FixL
MAIERLTTLIEDSLTLSSASLKAAAISVAVDLPDAELTVIADRIQVQQVMQNLIRNAADAMTGRPTRSLRIECRCLSDEWVQIEIIDTGPGLPAGGGEGNLFEAFHSGKPGGLGLGLSICRTIVEAHGGTIVAVPADGGGACFAFTLRRHINDNRELADASVEPDDPRH